MVNYDELWFMVNISTMGITYSELVYTPQRDNINHYLIV